MIDRRWELAQLATHPASQRAKEILANLEEEPNPDQPDLLNLVIAHLENQPTTGRRNFRAEMLAYAQEKMTRMSPFLAASYLVTNPEELDQELRTTNLSDQAAWTILATHLTSLLNLLDEAANEEAAAAVLEENLFEAIKFQHPNFGQPSPS